MNENESNYCDDLNKALLKFDLMAVYQGYIRGDGAPIPAFQIDNNFLIVRMSDIKARLDELAA